MIPSRGFTIIYVYRLFKLFLSENKSNSNLEYSGCRLAMGEFYTGESIKIFSRVNYSIKRKSNKE